ncbi:MAG: zinc-binding dehydrogenase, partial [Actinomycetota bacterium]
ADASDADHDLVSSLGADVVVPRGDDVAEAIRANAPDGVAGWADGSVQNELVLPALADGGAYTSVRGWAGPEGGVRGISFSATWVREYATEQARLDRLRAQAEEGQLTLRVAATYPAERAAEAHRRLEAGGTRGRLVIEF